MASSRIIRFLRGDALTYEGESLVALQSLPDHALERRHNVVQWMFPTDIGSSFYQDAPVLSSEDITILQDDLVIQGAISMSLTRMKWFYQANDYWITQKNHNFLRLTRILRCLWLAGMKHDYVSLSKQLDDIFIDYPDIVGEETFMFWKNANNDTFMKDPSRLPKPIALPPRPPPVNMTPPPPPTLPAYGGPYKPLMSAIEAAQAIDDENFDQSIDSNAEDYAQWFGRT